MVIVTGAGSGIGWATAARLIEEGASVMGADVKAPAEAPGTERFEFATLDVTDEAAVERLVGQTLERFGRLDGAVTAAGVAGGGPVHMLDAEGWRRVLDVNLTGTFLVAKHVIGRLLEREREADGRRGSVVTVASVEGLEGTAGDSAYSASKGGVVLLTKNMAIDYGPSGVRVNAVCPGFIDTPMLQGVFGQPGMEGVLADIVHEHKLRRLGRAAEIASAAAFLLSDDASFISGHALAVDGGYTAGRDHGVTGHMGLS